jgi:hypothetical protein
MAEETQFTIGADATCSDGVCGEVTRVVVDPVARVLTHLVIGPKHDRDAGRLVPLDLVDATPDGIRLGCTLANFKKLDPAVETQFLPGSDGYGGYGADQFVAWPYYGLGFGAGATGGMGMGGPTAHSVTTEAAPAGAVAIHRGDAVQAIDGDIGRVQGLVVDPRNRQVTHVLLQEGHLWGRKVVTIPIGAVSDVTGFDDGIRLNITKKDVEDLPDIEIDRPSL